MKNVRYVKKKYIGRIKIEMINKNDPKCSSAFGLNVYMIGTERVQCVKGCSNNTCVMQAAW